MLSLVELPHYHLVPKPAWAPGLPVTHLLHCRQALELRTAEVVLLLQGCRLQHEVLLLCSVHLLQVLRSCTGLPVQGLLDHLRSVGWVGGTQQECQSFTSACLICWTPVSSSCLAGCFASAASTPLLSLLGGKYSLPCQPQD